MSKTKSTRLNALYERLKNGGGLSYEQLAFEFGVSQKTLQRDFKDLQRLGAYKSGRLLCLDKARAQDELNSDERVVLGILNKLCKANGNSFYLKAKPLLTRLSQQLDQPIFVAAQSESLDDEDLLHFELVERLILGREELGFEYVGRNYEIKPIKIAYFQGFWYVLALDSLDNECFKKFYFKEMKQLRALGRKFELDESIEKRLKNAHSAWFNLNEPFFVQLLIEPKVAKYFKRRALKGATLLEQADGGAVLELEISHEMQIKPLIYEYIPHIRVLHPSWLNEKLKKELLAYARGL